MPYVRAGRAAAARVASRVARSAAVAASRSIGPRSTYRRGAYVKGTKRKWTRAVRQVINQNKESCFLDYSFGKEELYHNSFVYSVSSKHLNANATMPSQGDGDSNRTGNQIYAKGMYLRVMFLIKQDHINTKFRMLIVSFPKGYVPNAVSAFLDGVTGNLHVDPLDKGRCIKHIDKMVGLVNVNPNNTATPKESTIFKSYYIKMNKRITFYDDGLQDNNQTRDYYAIVLAYDSYGTPITDNIGAYQMWRRFTWKDL